MTIPFLSSLIALGGLVARPLAALGAAAVPTPAPELSVTLRGLVDDALEQGEPLRVAVSIESSGEANGRLELAPASGTWVDGVAVELLAASGATVIAKGTAVGAPASPRATVDRDRVAGGIWMFPASVTQGLARGDYIVRARLALKGGAGWSGEVSSEDAPFSIVAVSTAPDRVSARTFTRAQMALSQGAHEEAARLLDAVLEKTPDDFELLCLRADVALAGRNPMAAAICVGRAARTLAPKTPGPPPPMLHEVQSRVLAARLAESAAPANVPAWTWPPIAVMTLPEKEAAELREKIASTPAAASTATMAAQAPVVASAPVPSPDVSSPSSSNIAPASASAPAASPSVSVGTSIGTIVPSAELSEAAIRADTTGQWATSATAGTQYGSTQYSAAKATGAPDVPVAGNSPDAWCPASSDKGIDWLEVTFAKPVRATEVRVRQNDAAGAIVKVEAIEPGGAVHVWWEGVDPYQAPAVREIVWFAVRVPVTSYPVARVKLTLNLASGPGYKEVDAVQLVGVAP